MAKGAPKTTRETAAHHEAAHAVVACLLDTGRRVECVEIAQGIDAWPGMVFYEGEMLWGDYTPETMRGAALMTAAGRYGHETHLSASLPPWSDRWSEGDDDWLKEAARHAVGFAIVEAAYGAEDDVYDAAVAEQERLEQTWIAEINRDAKALVAEHWPLIERVAAELLSAPTVPTTLTHIETGVERETVCHRISGARLAEIVREHAPFGNTLPA